MFIHHVNLLKTLQFNLVMILAFQTNAIAKYNINDRCTLGGNYL